MLAAMTMRIYSMGMAMSILYMGNFKQRLPFLWKPPHFFNSFLNPLILSRNDDDDYGDDDDDDDDEDDDEVYEQFGMNRMSW